MNPTSLALELTHPVRLVCLAAVPVLLYYFYRSLVDFPRWQRSVSLAVRTAIVVLLVLALAGLTLLRPTTEQCGVLASGGNGTLGDALKASLKAGLPISTVPLATRNEPEVQVSAVTLPAQVRQGEPFYVEVVINSNHDDEGTITVYRGAHEVVRETRPIKKGENRLRSPH